MSIAAASDLEVAPPNPIVMRLAVAGTCVMLADWLLVGLPITIGNWPIGDWQIGIALPLFLGVLGVVAIACNRVFAARKLGIVMGTMFGAGAGAAMVILQYRARNNYLRSDRNWRGWSFRTWRLDRYLANNPDVPSNLSNSDRG